MFFKSEFFVSVCDGRYSHNLLETNREVLLVAERKLLRYLANRQTAVVEINFCILDFSLEEIIVRRDAELLLEYVNNMVFRIINCAQRLSSESSFSTIISRVFLICIAKLSLGAVVLLLIAVKISNNFIDTPSVSFL